MKTTVSSESLLIDNKELTLFSVSSGPNAFGICDTTLNPEKGIRETLYIGREAIVNTIQKSINDPYSNKIISQISSLDKCGDFSKRVANVVEERFEKNKSLQSSLTQLLDFLKNGLYIAYEADMIPTDGAGNFFWSSYLVNHELTGSSTFNPVCKKSRDLPPSFLVPTESMKSYSDSSIQKFISEYQDTDYVGGLCFHISGMFAALLSNHNSAAAAFLSEKKLRCVVIEPVRNICFHDELEESEIDDDSALSSKTDYLFTTFTKIPITKVPHSMLENFFSLRKKDTFANSDVITMMSTKQPHLKGARVNTQNLIEKCEAAPDVEMIQSAALIDSLSDEELEALIRGETSLNDKTIINKNYYISVTIACNYLQYKRFDKFIDFSLQILGNEDLTGVHQYIISRLQTIMNQQVYDAVCEISSRETETYRQIQTLFDKYKRRYNKYIEDKSSPAAEKSRVNVEKILKRDTELELNALDMAKKIQTVIPQRK